MKKLLLAIALLFIAVSVQSQETYKIYDDGNYIIVEGSRTLFSEGFAKETFIQAQ